MKSAKKYLAEKFESLGVIQEGIEEKKFRITDIDFDTDGDEEEAQRLKDEWIGKEFKAVDNDDAYANGADIISSESGWLVNSFECEEIKDIEEKKLTQAEIEALENEDEEDESNVQKIQRPKGSLRKGERFEEGKVYNEAFIAKTERWLDQSFLGEGSDIGIIDKIEQLTDENDHNGAVMVLAKFLKSPQHIRIMKAIQELHDAYGHMPSQLIDLRGFELKELLKDFAKRYGEQLAKKVQGAF